MTESLSDISIKFTEEILDQIIKNAGGLKHTAWRFDGGTKKGDNYISQTFRLIIDGIKVNGETIQLRTYVKTLPKNIVHRKTFRSAEFFKNECIFYNVVLTTYRQFQEGCNVENKFDNFPKCLASCSDGENDYIVLEDLGLQGYESPQRQTEFDYEICKLLMETLGKFHGMSLVIYDQDPEKFKMLTESIKEIYYAEEYRSWYAPVLKDQINLVLDTMSREYSGTIYEQKTKKFVENNLYDTMIALTHRQNKYSVLSHGDCWILNFLIKYNQSKPIEAKIIDFQIARYASPALDISFFIYSCTTEKLRSAHYNDLIQAYYKSARELLTALGSNADEVFPYSALLTELQECARYGIGMGMESIPLAIIDDSEITDLNTVIGEDAIPMDHIWKFKPIENDEGRRRFADVFKHAVDQGYI